MKTAIQLITEYKDTTPRRTWYQTAQMLDINETQFYSIRTGRAPMPEKVALKIAKAIKYPEELAVLAIHLERMEGKETAHLWQRIAANYEQKVANT